ncbi:MAG TPA: hypothetical protein VID96_03745 [Xanthobacteraceae bacterium]
MNRVFAIARAIAIAGLMSAAAPSSAHALDKVSIVVFGPPSLGAFLQPVIKQFKLDEANGLAIDFAERTPDAYAAQFNSGEFQVGGSAAVLTVGLADARGVKVAICSTCSTIGALSSPRAQTSRPSRIWKARIWPPRVVPPTTSCSTGLRASKV